MVTVGGPEEATGKGKKKGKGKGKSKKSTVDDAPANANEGLFVLCGPDAQVAAVGPEVAEALKGRGGGKSGRYQVCCIPQLRVLVCIES